MSEQKPILCLDFDGVIHYYATRGWEGADKINDPPVEGAMDFLKEAVKHFDVQIFSSRSNQLGGKNAMYTWLLDEMEKRFMVVPEWVELIKFPVMKPPAHITIDDRAITFDGTWPDMEYLINFKPWNKKD